MTQTITLPRTLSEAKYISRADNQRDIMTHLGGGKFAIITPQDLEDIDERLPFLLNHVIDNLDVWRSFDGSSIVRNVQYWHRELNQSRRFELANPIVSNWTKVLAYGECDLGWAEGYGLNVKADTFDFIDRIQMNGGFPYIALTLHNTPLPLDVDMAWMDKTYPGWQQRYTVAEELGYERQQLVDMVCMKPTPAVQVTMDTVQFD